MLNGRVDTMNSGVNSANNSLLLSHQPTNAGSGPNSLSKFGPGSAVKRESYKARASGGNDLLKAAIFKNAERNNLNYEDESPTRLSQKRDSVFSTKSDAANQNNEDDDYEVSNENTQVQSNFDKINTSTPDRHPSKLITGKRYSLIEGKNSNGNSPTLSSPNRNSPLLGKGANHLEETKSPY